jgi:hypothetical protein
MKFEPLQHGWEWDWFKKRTSVIAMEDSQGLVVYNGDATIAAGAVFDSFTEDGCQVHWAVDNPMVLRRGFLQEIARHLFVTRGRERIFGLVPDNNKRALKFDEHIGMREIARIPHALGEGVGYIVMTMTKDECRWLADEFKEEAA